MTEFDCWAEYYDIVHHGLPGEAEFYIGRAVRLAGPTLEIGCGTGRIAIPMAMSGVDVTGLDNSPAMLERCGTKLEAVGEVSGKLTLVEADMADFDLGRRFAFIAMAYRTFMHLLTPDEQRSCLDAVRRHLEDDGEFILSTWAAKPSQLAPHLGPESDSVQFGGRHEAPCGDAMLIHYCSSTYDEFHQILKESHLIHEVGADGEIVAAHNLPLVRAWTTPREMEHLLRAAGFEVKALFGDFDCAPFTEDSTEMIWVTAKRA